MKRKYRIIKVSQILIGLIILMVVSACSIKKQAFNYVEIQKDSIHSSVDTSYHSKEVTFEIEAEEETKIKSLAYSQDEFNRFLDSLFAEIDTTCLNQQLVETIIKTNGLWNTDTSYLETTLARSHAVVEGGKLYHFLQQKDTILKQQFDSLLQVIKSEREIWHSKEVLESSKKVTRSGFNIKLIAIIIIVLFLVWIILKRLI